MKIPIAYVKYLVDRKPLICVTTSAQFLHGQRVQALAALRPSRQTTESEHKHA